MSSVLSHRNRAPEWQADEVGLRGIFEIASHNLRKPKLVEGRLARLVCSAGRESQGPMISRAIPYRSHKPRVNAPELQDSPLAECADRETSAETAHQRSANSRWFFRNNVKIGQKNG